MLYVGRCAVVDIVPSEEDANFVRCTNSGVRITETDTFGHKRLRYVCPFHGFDPRYGLEDDET